MEPVPARESWRNKNGLPRLDLNAFSPRGFHEYEVPSSRDQCRRNEAGTTFAIARDVVVALPGVQLRQ
jgi:hypothetical protein